MILTGLYMWWPRPWRAAGTFWPRLSLRGPALAEGPAPGHRFLDRRAGAGHARQRPALGRGLGRRLQMGPDRARPGPGRAELEDRRRRRPWRASRRPMPADTAAGAHRKRPPVRLSSPRRRPSRWPIRSRSCRRMRRNASARRPAMSGPPSPRPRTDRSPARSPTIPPPAPKTGRSGFADTHVIDRIVNTGVAWHEGQLFGLANQLLGLVTAIALIAMSVIGVLMWLRRRPSGELGAPPRPSGASKRGAIACWSSPACCCRCSAPRCSSCSSSTGRLSRPRRMAAT